mmetsp:Transcript_14804/g.21343  ORF Transcript_14804/g.21343 Transcript_14804/m.21343 type:complete len:211 (+) Transcript_14804:111-743(+)|eukprot:CAMPEP_0202445726 /NCGR_PEP_ID=MMETSP1360-20130828/4477_1 /ASSEMBLY_ACC=CAM_ASM_000848 /TAXON_ID=515479 /ORGANISM="Licmophora paradoxa, Strain CCMP2313" /LENGTH=210 /DNA_ID=CAMNT_0049062077 /DNA_START=70 /DNA_END=702 /DNA_ORIENTATION=-
MPIAPHHQTRSHHHPFLVEEDRLPSSEFLANDPANDKAVAGASSIASTAADAACNNNNNNTKPQKRRLMFSNIVNVRPSLHVNDYTDEEYESCWYNGEEFDHMKKEMIPILRAVKQGITLPDFVSFRGLEYRTRAGSTARKANKLAGLTLVLEEQERQLKQGRGEEGQVRTRKEIYDSDEMIRAAYLRISQPCHINAQMMGMKDEADAMY